MSASIASDSRRPAEPARDSLADVPANSAKESNPDVSAANSPRQQPANSPGARLLQPCLSDEERSKLSPKQIAVLDSLVRGVSVSDTARRVQVSRHTIYRWLNLDPVVRCAFDRWKRLCEQSTEARLVALQETAVEVLAEELETNRNGKLAAMLLDKMGMLRPPKIDCSTVKGAAKTIELERKELNHKLGQRGKQISYENLFINAEDRFEEKEAQP